MSRKARNRERTPPERHRKRRLPVHERTTVKGPGGELNARALQRGPALFEPKAAQPAALVAEPGRSSSTNVGCWFRRPKVGAGALGWDTVVVSLRRRMAPGGMKAAEHGRDYP